MKIPDMISHWNKNKLSAEILISYAYVLAFAGMPLGTSPPTIFGFAALAIWIFSGTAFRSPPVAYISRQMRPILLIVLLPWIGLLYTPAPSGLGIDYAGKTYYWLNCLVIASAAGHARPEFFVRAFLLGLAVNAFVGLLQLLGLYPSVNGWYCGIGRGYSTLSAYLVIGILMASFYFRQAAEKRQRIFSAFLMAFYFFHLSILDGRTGYITFFALSPLAVLNLFGKKNILKVMLVCILLSGVLCLSPVVRNRIQLSAEQVSYHMNAPSDIAWGKVYTKHQDRFYMWRGAVEIFLENPVFGVGTGGYQTVLKERGKPEWPAIAHPHNDILHMAVSYGIIGLFAFFWLLGSMLRFSWKERHSVTGYFILSTAMVILVSGLFNGQTLDFGMAFLLAVTAGLQQHFSETKEKTALENEQNTIS